MRVWPHEKIRQRIELSQGLSAQNLDLWEFACQQDNVGTVRAMPPRSDPDTHSATTSCRAASLGRCECCPATTDHVDDEVLIAPSFFRKCGCVVIGQATHRTSHGFSQLLQVNYSDSHSITHVSQRQIVL